MQTRENCQSQSQISGVNPANQRFEQRSHVHHPNPAVLPGHQGINVPQNAESERRRSPAVRTIDRLDATAESKWHRRRGNRRRREREQHRAEGGVRGHGRPGGDLQPLVAVLSTCHDTRHRTPGVEGQCRRRRHAGGHIGGDLQAVQADLRSGLEPD